MITERHPHTQQSQEIIEHRTRVFAPYNHNDQPNVDYIILSHEFLRDRVQHIKNIEVYIFREPFYRWILVGRNVVAIQLR